MAVFSLCRPALIRFSPPAALLPLHSRRAQLLGLAVEALRALQARILHGAAFVAGFVGFDKAAEGGCFWFRHGVITP